MRTFAIVMMLTVCCSTAQADWSQLAETAIAQPAATQQEYSRLLVWNLRNGRGIAFSDLMTDNYTDTKAATAQAHSIAIFLSVYQPRRTLLQCFRDARASRSWSRAMNRYYGFRDLSQFQVAWVAWVAENQYQSGST